VYYSVSSWGKNRSAIGLATTRTLDPAHPDYGWKDQGIVVQSHATDDYNAIDPHVFIDTDGKHWLTFGSFWSGIKLLQLDSKTGKRAGNSPLLALATHREIEAPALTRHGEFYYLFVNWGLCCRGTNSTYEIRVGRSLSVTGPYVDKEGRELRSGGGSLFLSSSGPAIGPGHAAFHRTSEGAWLTCHYYDAANSGRPRLAILPLVWDTDGWPVVTTNSIAGVRGGGPTH
jgi:arabinan endo-1,5-alpha-L-arabinosidase